MTEKAKRNYPFRGKIYTAEQINNIISGITFDGYTKEETDELLDLKQDVLTAGTGISIENDIISASGSSYSAGNGINIENGVISLKDFTIMPSLLALVQNGYITDETWPTINKDFYVLLTTVTGDNNRYSNLLYFPKGFNADNANGFGYVRPASEVESSGIPLYDYLRLSNLRVNNTAQTYVNVIRFYYPCTDVSITVDGVTYTATKIDKTRISKDIRYNYTTDTTPYGTGHYITYLTKN